VRAVPDHFRPLWAHPWYFACLDEGPGGAFIKILSHSELKIGEVSVCVSRSEVKGD